ncbi:MAG: hypothetical protein HY017_05330 [Betaproteobacteria bacterium]|nr:hypothetical protein [Betaproteobacteria bacterium]
MSIVWNLQYTPAMNMVIGNACFNTPRTLTGRGNVINSGHAVEVHFANSDCSLLIRRTDMTSHPAFFDLHGTTIRPGDVAAYLPNWRDLTWTPVPHHALARSESYAKDGPFEINVQAAVTSGKDHAQVIGAFRQFMQSPAGPNR